ncbi:MAG: IS30 family transposase [Clostridiales bacterium]|nr:IS30 family transposase [Clostridiales bacterium]
METKKRTFKHLTWNDRLQIEALYRVGYKARRIAEEIGCSFKTIYNELKRGEYEHTKVSDNFWYGKKYKRITSYSPNKGQELYENNVRGHGIELKIGKDFEFANYIEKRIVDDGLTPLAVLGEIKKKGLVFNTTICVQTLYNYIKNGVFLRLSMEHLPYANKEKRIHKKLVIKKLPRGISIDKRPVEVSNRLEFGHWEMDCIESSQKKKATLLCLSERLSRREIIFKIPDKTSLSVVKCLNSLERRYGKIFPKLFKSITVDNGAEFSDYFSMQRSRYGNKKRTTIYYCHPYCSSERGTNERMNREIRRKFPKGTDFTSVSLKEVAEVEEWLNNYPRGILGYDTPQNVFNSHFQAIC